MKQKLIILDDELLILRSLADLFEDDYDVFTTADAESALGLAREHDIAVILCDERMPGMTGHEFLRRVKEVSAATRIMISGSCASRMTASFSGTFANVAWRSSTPTLRPG